MRYSYLAILALAAACAPAAEQAPPGPAPLDSVAARAAVEGWAKQYAELVVTGDAAGVAGLLTENATVEYFGFPSTTGRASIQALYTTAFEAARRTSANISIGVVNGSVPGMITAIGTNAETVDSAGVAVTAYWRWAGVYQRGDDAVWRSAYAMAFPDSTTRSKR